MLGFVWPSSSIWSDEAGLVIGSNGMKDDNLMGFIGLLNRLWDGQDFNRNRLTVKSAQIRGRRLTVSLMMQPVVLTRLLGAGDGVSRGMGWIARNLLAWPGSIIGSRPTLEDSAPFHSPPPSRARVTHSLRDCRLESPFISHAPRVVPSLRLRRPSPLPGRGSAG